MEIRLTDGLQNCVRESRTDQEEVQLLERWAHDKTQSQYEDSGNPQALKQSRKNSRNYKGAQTFDEEIDSYIVSHTMQSFKTQEAVHIDRTQNAPCNHLAPVPPYKSSLMLTQLPSETKQHPTHINRTMTDLKKAHDTFIDSELMMEVQTIRLKKELEALKLAQKTLLEANRVLTLKIGEEREVRLADDE